MENEKVEERSLEITFKILAEVAQERCSQDKAFGQQDHDFGTWAKVLMEQVGDASKATINLKPGNEKDIRKELIQVAAVAVAMIEAFDRGNCR